MEDGFPNLNCMWAAALVETLRRKGAAYAITCPGSRSSPLTFAFAGCEGIEAIPVLDERSAGFFALGLAKRTGKPVVLVCTSGSAVANFFPAVVEASEIGAPLVVLTADRPPELRDCAAGQTIDQTKLFGSYVRHYVELAVAENELGLLRYLRQAVSYGVGRCFGLEPGPVHLNVPLRDPLPPVAQPGFMPVLERAEFAAFFAGVQAERSIRFSDTFWLEEATRGERGLVLVGPNAPVESEAWCEHVAAFLAALQWPVLADGLNPLRSRAGRFPCLVSGYEFILRNEKLRAELRPERVLVLGELPTCKPLREWLAGLDVPMTVVAARAKNMDALRVRSKQVLWRFETDALPMAERGAGDYLRRWGDLDAACLKALDARMAGESGLFEGKVAWMLARALPLGSALCVSNSMPPRDMEFYFSGNERTLSVYGSRGANGIDGIVSTAMGVAHEGKATYLLVGDLAFLHDTNGLLLASQLRGSLTIVLVDNRGGGIFEMLPVAAFEPVFTKYFATEQAVRLDLLISAYGISFHEISNWSELEAKLGETTSGTRVLRVRTDRKADSVQRKRWFKEIASALGSLFVSS